MYIDMHSKKWNVLHQELTARMRFPSESVIRFIKGNFKSPTNQHILDLGCGSGRHTFFLVNEGYRVSAIDFSPAAIEVLRQLLGDNQNVQLDTRSILQLPYRDLEFDGVISYAVLYYFTVNDIKTIISEVYRVLKHGGKAQFVVRNIEDKRYGMGEEIERNTYKMSDDSTNEEGMIIHFFEENEIRELFAAFTTIKIGFIRESPDSLTDYNSDYIITVTK